MQYRCRPPCPRQDNRERHRATRSEERSSEVCSSDLLVGLDWQRGAELPTCGQREICAHLYIAHGVARGIENDHMPAQDGQVRGHARRGRCNTAAVPLARAKIIESDIARQDQKSEVQRCALPISLSVSTGSAEPSFQPAGSVRFARTCTLRTAWPAG